MSPPASVTLDLDGTPAAAVATAALLPRRVLLPRAALESLADRTGTPLPWRTDPAPTRLARALGGPGAAVAAEPHPERLLRARGLLTATGAPVAEVADALGVFASPEVFVRLDLGVRRPAAVRGVARFTAWHHHGQGRVTAVSSAGGPALELAWFADGHWQRELAHLVTVPPDEAAGSPADRLTLPYDLLLGSGAARRLRRPAVLAELLARHRVLGPDGGPLGAPAAAEQVRLLHSTERGRLQVTVAGVGDGRRALGVVTWVLFADGWRALVPATTDGVPVVHVVATAPLTLGAVVVRLVAGVQR